MDVIESRACFSDLFGERVEYVSQDVFLLGFVRFTFL